MQTNITFLFRTPASQREHCGRGGGGGGGGGGRGGGGGGGGEGGGQHVKASCMAYSKEFV